MIPLIIGLIYEGGPIITVPIMLAFIAIVLTAARLSMGLFGKSERPPESYNWGLNALLAMGAFAFILGMFGQNLGLIQGMQVIEQAGGVGPSMLAGGLKVALIAPTMGMSVLLIAGVLWFLLKGRQHQLAWQANA